MSRAHRGVYGSKPISFKKEFRLICSIYQGFDIARGRYDQPSHTIPHALSTRGLVSKMMPTVNNHDNPVPKRGRRDDSDNDAEEEEKAREALVNKESKRVTAGRSVQPILPEMRYAHEVSTANRSYNNRY